MFIDIFYQTGLFFVPYNYFKFKLFSSYVKNTESNFPVFLKVFFALSVLYNLIIIYFLASLVYVVNNSNDYPGKNLDFVEFY